MSGAQPVILDSASRSAPLGLRFWDAVTRQAIGDGLVVSIYPLLNPNLRQQAWPNRSSIFVFHRLPGLPEIEITNTTPDPFWTAPTLKDGRQAGFKVEVYDLSGRFLPFSFPITALGRGVFNWTCASLSPLASPLEPPLDLPLAGIPLFSSPARAFPSGMAAVRADLRQVLAHNTAGLKASWAVLEVSYKGKVIGRGLADQDGRASVICPYPQPVISSSSSGLLGSPLPLYQQAWKIEVRAYFQTLKPVPAFPDLCQVLSSPPVILQQPVCPTSPPGSITLNYGLETIIKTNGKSELFFTP